jgi:hypothetical protein
VRLDETGNAGGEAAAREFRYLSIPKFFDSKSYYSLWIHFSIVANSKP